MVFCCKTITDSPSRSGATPRKRSPSPLCRVPIFPSSISEFIGSLDYESASSGLLNAIPERDWRLLAALAKKREKENERDKLAEQFHKMWQQEKEERQKVEVQTSDQYKRYIHEKRQQERLWQENQRLQRMLDQQLRKGELMTLIRDKEQRSAELLAWHDGRKATEIIEKAIEEDARADLAAARRRLQDLDEERRRRLQLAGEQRRLAEAGIRRKALLRDASQRVAIANALNNWETSLLRQEIEAIEANQRAHIAARAAMTDARSMRIIRAKERRQRRARKVAAMTAQLREAVRSGNM